MFDFSARDIQVSRLTSVFAVDCLIRHITIYFDQSSHIRMYWNDIE
jgi:hypothetical protein